jgi:hypothetical protein
MVLSPASPEFLRSCNPSAFLHESLVEPYNIFANTFISIEMLSCRNSRECFPLAVQHAGFKLKWLIEYDVLFKVVVKEP